MKAEQIRDGIYFGTVEELINALAEDLRKEAINEIYNGDDGSRDTSGMECRGPFGGGLDALARVTAGVDDDDFDVNDGDFDPFDFHESDWNFVAQAEIGFVDFTGLHSSVSLTARQIAEMPVDAISIAIRDDVYNAYEFAIESMVEKKQEEVTERKQREAVKYNPEEDGEPFDATDLDEEDL